MFPVVGANLNIPNPLPTNVTEWDSTVLTGAPTNFGTAPSGTVIGGNVSIFAGGSALVVDGSGNLFVHLNAGSVGITGSVIATVSGAVTAEIVGHAGGILDAVVGAAIPANAVLIGANEGGNIEPLLLDGSGFLKVNVAAGSSGNAAASATGSAVPADADYLGASDGTNLIGLLVEATAHPNLRVALYNGTTEAAIDAQGGQKVAGEAASGSAVTGNPVLVAGQDGTDARTLLTDSTGVQAVNVAKWDGTALAAPTNFGTAPSGTVIGGNVSLFAGGSALVVDGSGNLFVHLRAGSVGITGSVIATVSGAVTANIEGHAGATLDAAPGSAIPTNAVMVGGTDGTDLRAILTDTSGRQEVVGAVANGLTVGGNPLLIAGSDGTSVRTVLTDSTGVQAVNVSKWDGAALAAPTNWGIAPSGTVIGGNVELFAGNSALVADGSGNLKVNLAAGNVVVAGIVGTSTVAVAGTSTVEVAGIVGTSTVAVAGVTQTQDQSFNGSFIQSTGASYASTATPTATLSGVRNGDTVIVGFTFTSSLTITSVTDSAGNIYSNINTTAAENSLKGSLYFASGVIGGNLTITVTLSSLSSGELIVAEYLGTVLLDNSGTNTSGASTAPNVTLTEPDYANSLTVVLVYASGGALVPQGSAATVPGRVFSPRFNTSNYILADMVANQIFTQGQTLFISTTGAFLTVYGTFQIVNPANFPVAISNAGAKIAAASVPVIGVGSSTSPSGGVLSVQGPGTNGAFVGTSTVEVAGIIGTSTVAVSSIIGTSTVAVSAGTINVQGTSTVTVASLTNVVGPGSAAGVAANSAVLIGHIATTATQTITGGQQVAGLADTFGNVRINPYGNTGSFTTAIATATGVVGLQLTVPAATKWVLKATNVSIKPTCSVSVTAQLRLFVEDGNGNVIADADQPTATTFNNTTVARITFAPQLQNTSSGILTNSYPELVLGPGFTINFLGAPTESSTMVVNVHALPD